MHSAFQPIDQVEGRRHLRGVIAVRRPDQAVAERRGLPTRRAQRAGLGRRQKLLASRRWRGRALRRSLVANKRAAAAKEQRHLAPSSVTLSAVNALQLSMANPLRSLSSTPCLLAVDHCLLQQSKQAAYLHVLAISSRMSCYLCRYNK